MEEQLFFRRATEQDSELLYQWRNDPETRSNSRDGSPVDRETHETWFHNSLINYKRGLFIIFSQTNKEILPLGVIRADSTEGVDTVELSWTIDPANRGKGWGKRALKQFVNSHPGFYSAVIKSTNLISRSIAQAAGFNLESSKGEYELWTCNTLGGKE